MSPCAVVVQSMVSLRGMREEGEREGAGKSIMP